MEYRFFFAVGLLAIIFGFGYPIYRNYRGGMIVIVPGLINITPYNATIFVLLFVLICFGVWIVKNWLRWK